MNDPAINRPWWQYIALVTLGAITIASAGITAFTTYLVLNDGPFKATVVLPIALLVLVTAFSGVLFLIVFRSASHKR